MSCGMRGVSRTTARAAFSVLLVLYLATHATAQCSGYMGVVNNCGILDITPPAYLAKPLICTWVLNNTNGGTFVFAPSYPSTQFMQGIDDSVVIYAGFNTTAGPVVQYLNQTIGFDRFQAPYTSLTVVMRFCAGRRNAGHVVLSFDPAEPVRPPCVNGSTTMVTAGQWMVNAQPYYEPPFSFAYQYPQNWYCRFLVVATTGHVPAINTSLSFMQLKAGDLVRVTDIGVAGNTTYEYTDRVDEYGNAMWGAITGTGSTLLVEFISGPSLFTTREAGFGLKTESLTSGGMVCPPTPFTVLANTLGMTGNVSSTGISGYLPLRHYLPGQTCQWLITTTVGQVIQFLGGRTDMEFFGDTVSIYDGADTSAPLLATFSSMRDVLLETYATSGANALVVFSTNADYVADRDFNPGLIVNNYQYGFLLNWQVTTPVSAPASLPWPTTINPCQGVVSMTTPISGGTISVGVAGNALNAYPRNSDCGWVLRGPINTGISFTVNFALGNYDRLDIYADASPSPLALAYSYSGTSVAQTNTLYVFTNNVYIRFRSDAVHVDDGWGFTFAYQLASGFKTCLRNGFSPISIGSLFYPQSPSTPGPYSPYMSNVDCQWLIDVPQTSIQMTFSSVSVSAGDIITIYSGNNTAAPIMYQGTRPLFLVTPGTPALIRFRSDNSSVISNGYGFTFSWTVAQVKEYPADNVVHNLTFLTQLTINYGTPNYLYLPYSGAHNVTWLYTAPVGVIPCINTATLSLGIGDRLIIYDGATTSSPVIGTFVYSFGSVPSVFSPSGGQMLFQLITVDGSVPYCPDVNIKYGLAVTIFGTDLRDPWFVGNPPLSTPGNLSCINNLNIQQPSDLQPIINCTYLQGNLYFIGACSGDYILPKLRFLRGTLQYQNQGISSLQLPALEYAIYLILGSNIYVRNITAPNLKHLDRLSMTTIRSSRPEGAFPVVFPSLLSASRIEMTNCDAISSLAFPSLLVAGQISFVRDNTALNNVLNLDFNRVKAVTISFNAYGFTNVQTLNLSSLVTCGSFSYTNNGGQTDNMQNVDLRSLRVADVFTIQANALLRADFPNLWSIGAGFQISTVGVNYALQSVSLPLLRQAQSVGVTGALITSFSLPSLVSYSSVNVATMPNLLQISIPLMRVGTVGVSSLNSLRILDLTNISMGGFTAGQSGSLSQVLTPNMISASFGVNTGSPALNALSFPKCTYGTSFRVASIDVLTVDAPLVRRVDSFTVTTSHLTEIAFPQLRSMNSASIASSSLLTSINLPQLLWVEGTFSLTDAPLKTLGFPSLTSIGSTLKLSSLPQLSILNFCKIVLLSSVTLTALPSLSCVETRQVFAPFALTLANGDCNMNTIGTFGCGSNFTRTVNVTGCGYTVACIQASITITYGNANLVVAIPPGTYTGCDAPLNFFGRSMTLQGGGRSVSFIDCQGVGTAFNFSGGETPGTIIQDLSVLNTGGVNGGALVITSASPTFRRVEILNSVALQDGGAGYISGLSVPVFVDCLMAGNSGVNGGGLALENEAACVFQNTTISSNTASGAGGGIAYLSALPRSVVTGLTLRGNTGARGGGVYTDVAVAVKDAVIEDNTATQYGGGLAAVPSETTGVVVSFTGSLLRGNVAPQGGGAFSYSATIVVTNSTFDSNAATDSGGAINAACSFTYRTLTGVQGPCPVFVNASSAEFTANTAVNNGAGIATQNLIVSLHDTTVESNVAGVTGAGVYAVNSELVVLSSSIRSNSAGSNGGGVYCEAGARCLVRATDISLNYAELSGGGVFFCLSSCQAPLRPVLIPDIFGATFGTNAVAPGGYGSQYASDPVSLKWAVAPQDQVVSGFPLAGSADQSLRLGIQDNYGQTVTSGVDALQLVATTPSGARDTGVSFLGPTTVLATNGEVIFAYTAAVAASLAATGHTYNLTCRHATIASVTVAAEFTLLPCGPGQGINTASAGVACQYCAAGTHASGGAATNYTCVPCGAGSIAASAGQAECSPCPATTYQPATGGTICLPCKGSEAVGSSECPQADAVSATVVGTVSGVAVVLIIAIIVVAICAYRYSQRRTMAKYYLDDDATVRRGVSESALALTVRKLLTTSSTSWIGGGQFTDVYRARHENAWVALKVLKTEMVGNSIAHSEFRREVHALSLLNTRRHPAIIELRFFLERAPVCLGLEFVAGGSLKRPLPKMKLSPRDKVRMATQVCAALSVMHSCNIAHMDLKTDNILIGPDGNLKVADFGICHMLGTGSGSATSSRDQFASNITAPTLMSGMSGLGTATEGIQMGNMGGSVESVEDDIQTAFTPQYVDSHRLLHEDDVSDLTLRRADVFTLGMVMWAIWAQDEPFSGIDPTQLVSQRKAAPGMRPRDLPDVHTCYGDIMRRAWSDVPINRPTVMECLAQLRACLENDFSLVLGEAYYAVGSDPFAKTGSTSNAPTPNEAFSAAGPPVPTGNNAAPEAYNSRLATSTPYAANAATLAMDTLGTSMGFDQHDTVNGGSRPTSMFVQSGV